MEISATDTQYVSLGLGAEVFAVPVSTVREILDYQVPFKIPEGPAYLLGLIDVRGSGLPAIDLRTKLGLPPKAPDAATRILVLDVKLGTRLLSIGLVADRVFEVVAFRLEEIEPAPDVGVAWRSDYIAGVVRRDHGFIVLFNLPRLLTSEDTALVEGAIHQAA